MTKLFINRIVWLIRKMPKWFNDRLAPIVNKKYSYCGECKRFYKKEDATGGFVYDQKSQSFLGICPECEIRIYGSHDKFVDGLNRLADKVNG